MEEIKIMPADIYTVINKTILTERDRYNLVNLYEPIIGMEAVSLYLTLWIDLEKNEIMSKDYTHHHLQTILKTNMLIILKARQALEAVGLLKTYLKKGDINSYVYELYSPMSAYDFFNHPVFNIILYNNLGKNEYENLKKYYDKPKYNLNEYEEISSLMNMTFSSVSSFNFDSDSIIKREESKINLEELIDFEFLKTSLPKNAINDKTFNKKTKELINALSFVYDLDNLKILEILRLVINEFGIIDKEILRKEARKYYQFKNIGALPTLIYRTQPEYLKSPSGDTSNRGKILFVFENTSPYDFLRSKYKDTTPTNSDLRLLEYLAVDLGFKPAVINVLIDYVLKKNNNKLNRAFIETIAGQWKRLSIETASGAMELAEKENKKYIKKTNVKTSEKTPIWFDKQIEKESISEEERQELDDLLKEFR